MKSYISYHETEEHGPISILVVESKHPGAIYYSNIREYNLILRHFFVHIRRMKTVIYLSKSKGH